MISFKKNTLTPNSNGQYKATVDKHNLEAVTVTQARNEGSLG